MLFPYFLWCFCFSEFVSAVIKTVVQVGFGGIFFGGNFGE